MFYTKEKGVTRMLIEVDFNSDEAIYIQLCNQIILGIAMSDIQEGLMKAGKKMKDVKAELLAQGAEAMMIENCGMPDEKIYRTVEEIPEDAGYYSLIIIKENKDRREE